MSLESMEMDELQISEENWSLIEKLETFQGVNLISDDAGHWAISDAGFQPVAMEGKFTETVGITSFVDPEQWKPTIKEALEYYFNERDPEAYNAEGIAKALCGTISQEQD